MVLSRRKRRLDRGFTLVEVLVTCVLLVVGVTVLLRLFSIGMIVDLDSENQSIAAVLAQEKMEEIKGAATYAAIDNFANARANLGGDFADFDREVTVSDDPKEIGVTVYWSTKGQEQNVTLRTLFTDYNFGT